MGTEEDSRRGVAAVAATAGLAATCLAWGFTLLNTGFTKIVLDAGNGAVAAHGSIVTVPIRHVLWIVPLFLLFSTGAQAFAMQPVFRRAGMRRVHIASGVAVSVASALLWYASVIAGNRAMPVPVATPLAAIALFGPWICFFWLRKMQRRFLAALALAALGAVGSLPWMYDNHCVERYFRPRLDAPGIDLSTIPPLVHDFRRADLHDAHLHHVTLSRADLSNADLSRVDLSEATIDGTRWRDAKVEGAILEGASLKCTTWDRLQAKRLRLARATIGSVAIVGGTFQEAHFENARFLDQVCIDGADLSRAHFEDVEAFKPTLINSKLWNARFDRTKLAGSDLRRSDLQDATLDEADLEGANLQCARLQHAHFHAAHFEQADLAHARLAGGAGVGAFFRDANLCDAGFEHADLRGADLTCADLRGANLENADLRGANLSGAVLDGTKMQNAQLEGAIWCGARTARAIGLPAGLANSDCLPLTALACVADGRPPCASASCEDRVVPPCRLPESCPAPMIADAQRD